MDESVRAFLDSIPWPDRRRDAETMIALMRRATGQEPRISGSIVGFGTYHYRYASGREGDGPAAAFAARHGGAMTPPARSSRNPWPTSAVPRR